MTIEHNVITDPYIHEPKGIAAAAVNKVYVADGAGSGVWQKIKNVQLDGVTSSIGTGFFIFSDGAGGFTSYPAAHGAVYFHDLGTPYTLAATTSYQKIAPTATANGSPRSITEGTTTKLTYTGTPTAELQLCFQMSLDHSAGADRDLTFALYENGLLVTGAEAVMTVESGKKRSIFLQREVSAATGDYWEIYCKVSSAVTVNFYSVHFNAAFLGV